MRRLAHQRFAGADLRSPGGHQFLVMGWSTNGWNSAKRALSFAELTNDGDDEGAFILDRLPTRAEAAAARKWIGAARKRQISEEERECLAQHMRSLSGG